MNKFFKYIVPAAALLLTAGFTSCVGDLDVEPIDPGLQSSIDAEQLFNKCYANFAVAGNGGANGDSDVDGIDGGTSGLFRQMWNSNELTTDEAICGWGDEGINTFCFNSYNDSHPMLRGYYYRLCAGIAFCNHYIDEFGDYDATMTAEVRFLRAFQYYLFMDAFGNVPFATSVSTEKPVQYTRAQMFEWIEGELKAVAGENPEDNANVLNEPQAKKKGDANWGRVDKAAAWLLLSRLYLNAEVYTGTAHWQDAANYAKMVIDSPYRLLTEGSVKDVHRKEALAYYDEDKKEKVPAEPAIYEEWDETWEFTPYQMLFMGDNAKTDAAYEAIFPLIQDGQRTTSWGVSLFLMASTHDGDMHPLMYRTNDYAMSPVEGPDGKLYDRYVADPAVNGVAGQAWGGNRARPDLIRLFFPGDDAPEVQAYDMYMAAGDDRALFCSEGRTLDVTDVTVFKNGYGVSKFSNFTTDNSATSDATFPDMHTFMMRKAEAYLTYAEALTRLAGGSAPAEALNALNIIRDRAHAAPLSNASLQTILDEWGREFYFEGRRRVDLIRFGKFGGTTDYKWQWKGGVMNGRDFQATRNVFAIPKSDIIANKNLVQNPGY